MIDHLGQINKDIEYIWQRNHTVLNADKDKYDTMNM